MPQLIHQRFASLRARIGVSRRDITPDLDVCAKNWGAARHWFATGVHRRLAGTAMAVGPMSGGPPLLLISLELGWWRTRRDADALRKAVLDATGLPEANVIIHLTHTHAGPVLDSDAPAEANPDTARAYLAALADHCVAAAREAVGAMQPATMIFRNGRCSLASERDFVDPADSKRFLTGFHPGAPADDALLVARAFDDEGRTLATLVNYACHPTTLAWDNRLISPDYPGVMREFVESETAAPCLFLLGACGEYAPAEQYTGEVLVAEQHGRELAHAVLATLQPMRSGCSHLRYDGAVESGAPLATWSAVSQPANESVRAAMRAVDLELKPDLPTLAEIESMLAEKPEGFAYERLLRKRRVRMSFSEASTSVERIWTWQIGDAVLCGVPFEGYAALQQELRAAFPARTIIVMNIANGILGYLPPVPLYEHDIYTVWQTPFARGSLERVIAAAKEGVSALLNA
ncbi:MAG: neutral/alkaline non-lysosomal ceramidase N-terminal domain-containing protein [Verrucomicrobiaceae bacterium]|nr:neutral/alkaline non-lysosomal ceramidase N-terminal domain-containing protein [Verrucomicrobiaceae bacterium]